MESHKKVNFKLKYQNKFLKRLKGILQKKFAAI